MVNGTQMHCLLSFDIILLYYLIVNVKKTPLNDFLENTLIIFFVLYFIFELYLL